MSVQPETKADTPPPPSKSPCEDPQLALDRLTRMFRNRPVAAVVPAPVVVYELPRVGDVSRRKRPCEYLKEAEKDIKKRPSASGMQVPKSERQTMHALYNKLMTKYQSKRLSPSPADDYYAAAAQLLARRCKHVSSKLSTTTVRSPNLEEPAQRESCRKIISMEPLSDSGERARRKLRLPPLGRADSPTRTKEILEREHVHFLYQKIAAEDSQTKTLLVRRETEEEKEKVRNVLRKL